MPASVAGLAADCAATEQVAVLDSRVGTVPEPGPLIYQTTVPVAGWMDEDLPSDDGPTPEQGVRALWEGRRILWIGAGAPDALAREARAAARENPHWRAEVLQWPAGYPLQLGSDQVVAATWGEAMSCRTVSSRAIDEFFGAAPDAPGRPGQIPPSLTQNDDEASA
ncbi:hypothetical protein HF998_00415 [Cellulomonas hominis]|uniref:Uncharacterized protein n=1 Tax=Cellulomonas hominis TaxID=156981 RepID=A0A7W8SGZ4_9CELL|nr:hypothetical protein [Cellulomonas hominis]MBB5474599.1 hypothetical protein [Cellulomonas hominis]NKY05472.1 hypothetical protein [Cellulomonas hominis]